MNRIAPNIVEWLIDSDPGIRWQVMRDIIGSEERHFETERTKTANVGFGAELLALQRVDGTWGGVAWNRGWSSTMHVLMLLREIGVDPKSPKVAIAIERVRRHVTWKGSGPPEADSNGFFEGEIETCINAQVAAVGSYFGQNVQALIDRLLEEQLSDGGWNCEAAEGSRRSSFNTTICVLEALLEYEKQNGLRPDVTAARIRGQEYLMNRRMFRRLSTGEPIRDRKSGEFTWSLLSFPNWWHYDILRGLDYLRAARLRPDERIQEAVDIVSTKQTKDGMWPLELVHRGTMPIKIGAALGQPDKWLTLKALRVIQWAQLV